MRRRYSETSTGLLGVLLFEIKIAIAIEIGIDIDRFGFVGHGKGLRTARVV